MITALTFRVILFDGCNGEKRLFSQSPQRDGVIGISLDGDNIVIASLWNPCQKPEPHGKTKSKILLQLTDNVFNVCCSQSPQITCLFSCLNWLAGQLVIPSLVNWQSCRHWLIFPHCRLCIAVSPAVCRLSNSWHNPQHARKVASTFMYVNEDAITNKSIKWR